MCDFLGLSVIFLITNFSFIVVFHVVN